MWIGCHLQLRQIARQRLAKQYDRDPEEERGGLFKDLQWRYPSARSADLDDPVYVLRDQMTAEDVGYNVARLRAEASAKQQHADALEAWWEDRSTPAA